VKGSQVQLLYLTLLHSCN